MVSNVVLSSMLSGMRVEDYVIIHPVTTSCIDRFVQEKSAQK